MKRLTVRFVWLVACAATIAAVALTNFADLLRVYDQPTSIVSSRVGDTVIFEAEVRKRIFCPVVRTDGENSHAVVSWDEGMIRPFRTFPLKYPGGARLRARPSIRSGQKFHAGPFRVNLTGRAAEKGMRVSIVIDCRLFGILGFPAEIGPIDIPAKGVGPQMLRSK